MANQGISEAQIQSLLALVEAVAEIMAISLAERTRILTQARDKLEEGPQIK